jgi:DNA-directed RNA polymerase subunit L
MPPQVKVQTRSEKPGPVDAVQNAINLCEAELEAMRASFRKSLQAFNRSR